jgi:hypothetical protein
MIAVSAPRIETLRGHISKISGGFAGFFDQKCIAIEAGKAAR